MNAPKLDKIYLGDTLSILRRWPDNFVHCVVTSPPYWGLRDYGVPGQIGLEPTPQEYVTKMVEVLREVRRVLRDDGTLWLNIGDCYAAAVNGSGSGKQLTNRGTLADGEHQKPRKEPLGYKPKDLVGIPWTIAFALRADGWYLRRDIIWSKPNPMPESVIDRPTSAHEYLFLLSKSATYYYDADAIKEPSTFAPNHSFPDGWATEGAHDSVEFSKRSRASDKQRGHSRRHTGFNQKLIEPCILAGSPPGGTVLDPFMGAGTTALVASRFNRRFLGIELNPKYLDMANKRIAMEVAQQKMF